MTFIPVAEPDLSQLELDYLTDAFKSGWISSLGDYIEKFEKGFALLCGTRYAVSVSNGTVGLHLALIALGVEPGDEVVVPSLTFVATAAAVRHAGAVPVFVDCDLESGTMDPSCLANAITDKTKAIVVVHLYGHPCEMNLINEIAAERNLPVIEDAAEAHGAKYHGATVGGLGSAGVFSFYGNKLLTTGEGGAITTNDPKLNKRLRFLRDHAMDPTRRYWHPEVGFNYRLTNLQAAVGVAQLERYDEITAKRQQVLAHYRDSDLQRRYGIKFNPTQNHCESAPWLVCAWLPDSHVQTRDQLCSQLRTAGIDTRPFFYPIHEMPPYKTHRCIGVDASNELNNSINVSQRGFNLPSSPSLSERTINQICDQLKIEIKKLSPATELY